jgi:hypothetical protein
MPRLPILLLISFALISSASAQDKDKKDAKKDPPPKVLYAVPLVAKSGEKQKLTLRGKNLDAVKEVKVVGADDAKVKVLGAKKAPPGGNQPAERVGDSEVEMELELPKDAKPGAVKLAAVGPGGESNPYTLLIADETPAVAEKEPNDGFDTAQPVPVPSATAGTIKNDRDPDVFKFEGKKGDKLRIEVQAVRFGSPLDALVQVFDADRRLIAAADDSDGMPDPIVIVTLPRDGTYFVTLIDAHDLGGPQFGYRLVVKKENKD